jgi:rhodanese-related sulfurtransferase
MSGINLGRVVELQNHGAQVVEVLSRKQFDEQHIPGAISLPLSKFKSAELAKLDEARAVIVYCWDYQWDLSARAAARLEAAGFREVYDYIAGKADWIAMGMPIEGMLTEKTIQQLMREVPTCELAENLMDVKAGIPEDWNISVVVDPKTIVLGLLDLAHLQDSKGSIENLMNPAPLTLRPSLPIADALAHFQKSDLMFALVTRSTGELIGAVRKKDLESVKEV